MYRYSISTKSLRGKTSPFEQIFKSLCFLIFFFTFIFFASTGQAQTKQQILILHSYHKGFTWTDSIDRALRETLSEKADLEIVTEYLDSKRWPIETVMPAFAELLKTKYADSPPAAIILSDNNALTFLKTQYRTLFYGTPVIFCGVNNYHSSMLDRFDNHMTGIIEQTDPAGTVSLILQLQPSVRRLFIVTGTSPTAREIKIETEIALVPFKKNLALTWWDKFSTPKLLDHLKQLSDSDAVLLISFNRDPEGNYYSYEDSAKMISQASPAPVYGMWDFYLNTGIVGGKMICSNDQGIAAAKLCLEILNTGAIPAVVNTSPNKILVDYTVIADKKIAPETIPLNATVINQPYSFYHTYKRLIQNVVLTFVVLVIACVGALFGLIKARKSEKQMQQSKENLRITLNSIGDAVIATDTNGGITQMNPVAEKLTGWSFEEALGQPLNTVFKIINAHTRKPVDSPVKKVLDFGCQVGLANHTVLISKDNREYQIADSAAPIKNRLQQLEGVVLVFRDITEEYALFEALKKSEILHRTLFEKNYNAIFFIHRQSGICLDANPAAEILTERPVDELKKLTIREFWPQFDSIWRGVGQETDLAMDFGEVLLYASSHAEKITRVNCVAIDEYTIVAFIRDITQEKRAQIELINSRENFSKIFLHSPVWMLVSTIDQGRYIEVNNAFHKITGYSREEVIGKTSIDIGLWINKEDRQPFMSLLEKNGKIDAYPSSFRMKDGSIRDFLWSAVVIELEGKKCSLSTLIDITEIENTRKEKDRIAKQLHYAQKMEAIGTLASGIAHDFNNILSGIFGYTNLIQRNLTIPEKVSAYITQIDSGAQRATELVRQILTYSREVEHKTSYFKIYLVIKEALKFLRSSIPSSIQIHEDICSHAAVIADPTQVHQVIMNLCTNASHAMQATGGILTVKLRDHVIEENDFNHDIYKPGSYVIIEISDTGHGMDDKTLSRIFDPYFSTKKIGEGTGLGLAVVDGIIKKHNGYIKTLSKINHGTTFQILWPIAKNTGEDNWKDQIPQNVIKGTEHILIIDDEEAILNTTQKILEEEGYEITIKQDAISALECFEKSPERFALIITDMTMPSMTGTELAKKVLQSRKNVPIILCTGYNANLTESTVLEIGIKKLIYKPVRPSYLLKSIREVLDI
ncbi:MAG: PAS domain S-box protein [Pseudomonadota bacterium]